MDKLAKLESGCFYHVFNRTNNRELLFKDNDNRKYFLSQYIKYLSSYINTHSFSLLPNHFHFSISVKPVEALIKSILEAHPGARSKKQIKYLEISDKDSFCHDLISSQFSRFFTSYSNAFNKKFNRHGNLFHRPFKRIRVETESHFSYLQYYIHHNARKHKIVKEFHEHRWNSWHMLMSNEETFLDREYIFDYFGNKDAFVQFHEDQHLAEKFEPIIIED
jgi:REP element-mobilizing transposase RayT